jgi:uracil-DNA glycosylase
MATTDWNPLLRDELEQPYWAELRRFVDEERRRGPVYPPASLEFAALHLTSYASTRVVILGQDPYHGAGQAHGLCFSVQPPTPPPPSLNNIFVELEADLGVSRPAHGDLTAWARQGVLLLNTCLTVRAGQAGSHHGKGWETFTDAVLRVVNGKPHPVVFVLWGAQARKKRSLVDTTRHVVIESAHPSPLSAHNGFLGSRPFSRINAALIEHGLDPIDWRLP